MVYICSHIKPSYTLKCPYEVIDNTKSSLPESYRHLRGMLQILQGPLPDEIGIFQRRRFLNTVTIPDGYDCVVPKDFGNFNIRNQFAQWHHVENLDLCEEIINDSSFSEWIRRPNNDACWMHNIGIWKKYDFIEYCNFLFTVFNEYEIRKGNADEVCWLAERLGAYWVWKNIPRDKIFETKTFEIRDVTDNQ